METYSNVNTCSERSKHVKGRARWAQVLWCLLIASGVLLWLCNGSLRFTTLRQIGGNGGCPFHQRVRGGTTRRHLQQLWGQERLHELETTWTENQDWKTKLDRIWNTIRQSTPVSNRYVPVSEFVFRLAFMGEDFTRLRLPLTFRPYTTPTKLLHSSGVYGRIQLAWTDARFRDDHTGLFSEPLLDGIMSASGGNPYVGNQSVAYGWGFKFFRSNASSATILTLNAFLGGGASWNVFGYMTCNHVSIAEMSVLGPTIAGWSRFPNQNGLKTMADYTLNGTSSSNPRFPYALCFVPNLAIRDRIGTPTVTSANHTIPLQLQLVNAGERMFTIIAILHPRVLADSHLLKNSSYARAVGHVDLVEPFRRSQYADTRLFFQHQPFDDDLVLRPDWLPYMTVRNLLREGAFGVYRTLFSPPHPSLQEQLKTLATLVHVALRFFASPKHQAITVNRLLGLSDIMRLLTAYIQQRGPPNLHWALTGSGVRHNPTPDDIGPHKSWIERQLHLIETVFSKLVLGWHMSPTEREAPQLAWGPTIPKELRTEDPFSTAYIRSINLTRALRNYYATRQPLLLLNDSVHAIPKDLKDAVTNVPTVSLNSIFVLPATIILNYIQRLFVRENNGSFNVLPRNVVLQSPYFHEYLVCAFLAYVLELKPVRKATPLPPSPPLDDIFPFADYVAGRLRTMDSKLVLMHFVSPLYWRIAKRHSPERERIFTRLLGNLMGFVPRKAHS